MAQADQTVQNDTFPNVRADINNNLAALFSNSSGNVAPTVTVAHMDWIDTSGADPVWKKRNAANNGWITIGTVKTSALEFSGTNTLPSQTGNSGKYLTTDGTTASWGIVAPGSSVTTFTSSGTWTKPSSGTMVYVEMWAGGGGGAKGTGSLGGGGGGGFRWLLLPLSFIATSTVSITVGAGGAGATVAGQGTTGGNSSFGSYATIYGGQGGQTTGTAYGGGWRSGSIGYADSGLSAENGLYARSQSEDSIGLYVGGVGGAAGKVGEQSVHGGGGGGGTGSVSGRTGGASTFGGAGGAGQVSVVGDAGSIPAGGGGASYSQNGGNGARGEVRVYVW